MQSLSTRLFELCCWTHTKPRTHSMYKVNVPYLITCHAPLFEWYMVRFDSKIRIYKTITWMCARNMMIILGSIVNIIRRGHVRPLTSTLIFTWTINKIFHVSSISYKAPSPFDLDLDSLTTSFTNRVFHVLGEKCNTPIITTSAYYQCYN